MVNKLLSIIIPVYRNEESIPDLIAALSIVAHRAKLDFDCSTEVVVVVDGSPDGSFSVLSKALSVSPFASQLLSHSRNFGSFAAIRSGLQAATGNYFGVVAADLQEPPELILKFLEKLSTEQFDVVVGCRENRQDPFLSRVTSNLFWKLYRRFVIPEIPKNGVDVFACNQVFREHLISLEENNTSLIGLIYWLGFKRSEVAYERRFRPYGKSAWTLNKKINYLLDSVFSFSDLPIKLLSLFGLFGVIISLVLGVGILSAKLFGNIAVPGYAATVLTVIFFGALNSLGLGIVGMYAWRAFENTKNRPLAITMSAQKFDGESSLIKQGPST